MTTKTLKKEILSKITRPPIVVVVGHIDHGKTTLLDTIRKTKIAEKESGGITQHIGAYEITHNGKEITFIDTPGHEAFSKMRSRGASVADIGILVVAADEGVKPQTKEAIAILTETKIPFIVAINKIDKPEANSERVKKELAENNILLESWGGKIPSVEISAKQGKNLDALLELILLTAEVEELEAHTGPAKGVVIESHRDKQRGNTATILILDGNFKRGDYFSNGATIEPVKILEDFLGTAIQEAHYSMPVRISSLSILPEVGEEIGIFADKKDAEAFGVENKKNIKEKIERASPEEKPTLFIVLKSDVSGSKEAIEGAFEKLQYPEVGNVFLKNEVGDVSEADIKTAAVAPHSVIAAFKVKVPGPLKEKADRMGVKIIQSDIIYDLIEQIKKEMSLLVIAEIVRTDTGRAKILALFKKLEGKQIIGGKVTGGKIMKGGMCEIKRGEAVLGIGKIKELQHLKKAVDEVKEGLEFGAMIETPAELFEGDAFIVFQEEKVYKKL